MVGVRDSVLSQVLDKLWDAKNLHSKVLGCLGRESPFLLQMYFRATLQVSALAFHGGFTDGLTKTEHTQSGYQNVRLVTHLSLSLPFWPAS